jgi:hypothetical protein
VFGLRFVATDVAWAVGTGLEVRGPIAALLMTLAGRGAALEQLDGEGIGNLSSPVPPSDRLHRVDRTF